MPNKFSHGWQRSFLDCRNKLLQSNELSLNVVVEVFVMQISMPKEFMFVKTHAVDFNREREVLRGERDREYENNLEEAKKQYLGSLREGALKLSDLDFCLFIAVTSFTWFNTWTISFSGFFHLFVSTVREYWVFSD